MCAFWEENLKLQVSLKLKFRFGNFRKFSIFLHPDPPSPGGEGDSAAVFATGIFTAQEYVSPLSGGGSSVSSMGSARLRHLEARFARRAESLAVASASTTPLATRRFDVRARIKGEVASAGRGRGRGR